MSKAASFFGETTDKSHAFFGIEALEMTIIQDRWEHYTRNAWQRESRYTLNNITRYHRCANPRCQQGGLDLQHIVSFCPDGEHVMDCNGHEGSPAGRRKGDPCDNSFVVTIMKTKGHAA